MSESASVCDREKRYAVNEIVKVIVPRDEPVTVEEAIRENLVTGATS